MNITKALYKTTKRPWNCDPNKRKLTIGWVSTSHIKDELGFPIANVRSKEDGELIVKYVNMHDALLSALKETTALLELRCIPRNVLDHYDIIIDKAEKGINMPQNKSMEDREELMKQLSDIGCLYPKVIYFILEDRKRIRESISLNREKLEEIFKDIGFNNDFLTEIAIDAIIAQESDILEVKK